MSGKELVAFIQNRLNQLGLLNDRYELSEHGQELLKEWQNKSDGNLEYTVATVFVDSAVREASSLCQHGAAEL
uniref:hypothetical protein n=1 Tax=Vibrio cholerae TaxID=666 RepID=UPI003F58E7D4